MKNFSFILFRIVLISLSMNCSADLSSQKYQNGKREYIAKNWQQAKNWLSEYENEDISFLEKNPAIKRQIDEVITYCSNQHEHTDFNSHKQDNKRTPPPLPVI